MAIALSLCPKVGAAISAIPPGVLGGATIVLYGLVGVLGVRIWLTNGVDFAKPLNQMTAAIPLIIGIADFTWHLGDLTFTGIALGSIAALLVYHGMRLLGLRTTNGRRQVVNLMRHALVRRPSPRLADGLITHIDRSDHVDAELAQRQWDGYVAALRDAGWTTHEVPAAPDCPDSRVRRGHHGRLRRPRGHQPSWSR